MLFRSGTKYMTGALRNMQGLTNDFNDFYGTETELWRIQKILTNVNVKIKDICMLVEMSINVQSKFTQNF